MAMEELPLRPVQEPQEELLPGLPPEPPLVGTLRLLEPSRGVIPLWCSRRMEVSLETSASPSVTMVS